MVVFLYFGFLRSTQSLKLLKHRHVSKVVKFPREPEKRRASTKFTDRICEENKKNALEPLSKFVPERVIGELDSREFIPI